MGKLRDAYLMNVRANLGLGAVTAAVVGAAVGAAIVTSNQPDPHFDPGTPQGVVERYVAALVDGEPSTAVDLLDPRLGCDVEDVRAAYYPGRTAVVYRHSSLEGGTTRVTVRITRVGEGVLDDVSHEETFELSRLDGEWHITGEPWPVYVCGEGAQ
ncbi:MAG TPA: hypothetical protein VK098_11090 [Beutenbergiaceae bacterium]|nr:hypothetical protein [Beutenbergiaceae bacterium]